MAPIATGGGTEGNAKPARGDITSGDARAAIQEWKPETDTLRSRPRVDFGRGGHGWNPSEEPNAGLSFPRAGATHENDGAASEHHSTNTRPQGAPRKNSQIH